jgi:hypothetical protein
LIFGFVGAKSVAAGKITDEPLVDTAI